MARTSELGILPEPPGPGFFASCPNCKRHFSLKLESAVPDEKVGKLRTYVCNHCGEKFTFAAQRPPGCI